MTRDTEQPEFQFQPSRVVQVIGGIVGTAVLVFIGWYLSTPAAIEQGVRDDIVTYSRP